MTNTPLVSVIIPTFNYGSFIGETISAVMEQTYPNWEIIIVDDGSTDNTKSILVPFLKDQRIQYFYKKNAGLSAARNTGLSLSKGDFLQFLDADDLISPSKIERQITHFYASDEIGISYTPAYYFTDQRKSERYRTVALTDTDWMPKLAGDDYLTWLELIKRNIMPINAALVRRNVIETVGLFDVDLKSLEDWDYWLRCATFTKICYLEDDEGFALIRVHPNSMSKNEVRMATTEIELRTTFTKRIKQTNLTSHQKLALIGINNKSLKLLVSNAIRNHSFLHLKLLTKMGRLVGYPLLTKAYLKAINDKRKN